jgi:hypothetical protein
MTHTIVVINNQLHVINGIVGDIDRSWHFRPLAVFGVLSRKILTSFSEE